jgi:hypothetical protein
LGTNAQHHQQSAELNPAEAAELLGVSERTFRRWRNADLNLTFGQRT